MAHWIAMAAAFTLICAGGVAGDGSAEIGTARLSEISAG
jgi:hypothetical protein